MITSIVSTHRVPSHWQIKLNGKLLTGEIVSGLDDISQALRIILNTPRGSDPLRPLFGCNLIDYLDWPENEALAFIIREIFEAIGLWEPRINLYQVKPRRGELGQWIFTLSWQVKDGILREIKQGILHSSEVAYAA